MVYQSKNISSNTKREIKYWQNKLDNITPLLDFPTDRPRTPIFDSQSVRKYSSAHTKKHLFTVSQEIKQALQDIALAKNVSLSTVLFTTWQILIYRYSNQTDLTIGYLHQYDNLEQGSVLLPIRTIIKNQQNFTELLAANQEQITECSEYSTVSINTLAEALNLKKSEISSNSLFSILFDYNNSSTASSIEPKIVSKKELSLKIAKTCDAFSCQIEYDSQLFNSDTIERVANNYQTLLRSIITESGSIDSLSLISPQEI